MALGKAVSDRNGLKWPAVLLFSETLSFMYYRSNKLPKPEDSSKQKHHPKD